VDIPSAKDTLSAGLLLAADVLKHEKYTHPEVEPLLIVLTDGAAMSRLVPFPRRKGIVSIAELIPAKRSRVSSSTWSTRL